MKRPRLKTPEPKVPTVLSDLYYDLRDRRLLPLIGLVVVAIVATPFLLGRDSEIAAPPATPAAIQALKEGRGRATASLTVVEAHPGLRDYRRRLGNRTPLDPFRQPKPSLKGARLGGAGKEASSGSSSASFSSTSTTVKKTKSEEGSSKTTTTTTTTTTSGGDDKGSTGGGGSKGSQGSDQGGSADGGTKPGGGNGGAEKGTYVIDVQITMPGTTSDPLERHGVDPLTPLPGKKTPVITYVGPAAGGSRAVFDVSREVVAIYGEATCVSGTDTCEMLELEPNFPVTFVYGPNQDRYKIKLLKIEPAG